MKQRKGRIWRHIKPGMAGNNLQGGFWTMRSRRFFRHGASHNTSFSVMYMHFFKGYRRKRLYREWKRAYSCYNVFDPGKQWACYWNGSDS